MEVRAFQVECFGRQQALSVARTQVKLIDNVRVFVGGGVCILDVLRHVKRGCYFDESASTRYLMCLWLFVNSIFGYLVRHYLPCIQFELFHEGAWLFL